MTDAGKRFSRCSALIAEALDIVLLTGDDDEVTLMDNCLSGRMREALAGTLDAGDRDAVLGVLPANVLP